MGWPWKVTLHAERLDEPLKWRKPQVASVAYMGDLFHKDVPDEFIDRVFAVMAITPRSTYLLLTKRADLAMKYLAVSDLSTRIMTALRPIEEQLTNEQWLIAGGWGATNTMPWPLPNVWLGVSVEDQATADQRIPLLVRMKAEGAAAHIWVSFEPLLENLSINHQLVRQLDWAVIGGESGPKARRMRASWLAQLASQCATLRVKCYVKQASHRYPGRQGDLSDELWARKAVPW